MTLLKTKLQRVQLPQCITWRKAANIQSWKLTSDRLRDEIVSFNHPEDTESLKCFTSVHVATDIYLKFRIYSVTYEDTLKFVTSRGQPKTHYDWSRDCSFLVGFKTYNTAFSEKKSFRRSTAQPLQVSSQSLCPGCKNTTARAWLMNINLVRSSRTTWLATSIHKTSSELYCAEDVAHEY